MPSFAQSHTDVVLRSFAGYAHARGFRQKRKDLHVREADDGLIQAINVGVHGRRGVALSITPNLLILHYGVGEIVGEALDEHSGMHGPRLREVNATLDGQHTKFLLPRTEGKGAMSGYFVADPATLDQMLSQAHTDTDRVIDEYFSSRNSLADMIDLLMRDRAARAQKMVKLLAMLCFAGRQEDLRRVADEISEQEAAPMTLRMKRAALMRIGVPEADLPPLREPGAAPAWPPRRSREQQRLDKERREAFETALKAQARGAGWRYASGGIFRQDGDWFVSNAPLLSWNGGVRMSMGCKPMALDRVFWEIADIAENQKLPLSFRMNGAWVLQPSPHEAELAVDEQDPAVLAAVAVQWSDQWLRDELPRASISGMLSSLGDLEALKGRDLSLAICLSILAGDLEQASRLCRARVDHAPKHLFDSGFVAISASGTASSFAEQAARWLVKKRRDGLAVFEG